MRLLFSLLLPPLVTAVLAASESAPDDGEKICDASAGPDACPEKVAGRLDMWRDRWAHNMTGWHKTEVHHVLREHLPQLLSFTPHPPRIFVPLCGKTTDMAFLAGIEYVGEVLGLDGVRAALATFAEEHPDLGIDVRDGAGEEAGRLVRYGGGGKLSLLEGDFFAVDAAALGGTVDVVWDRGAMVALDPDLRGAYADTIGRVLRPGGVMLVSTYDRRAGTVEGKAGGPPFSVDRAEMRRVYAGLDWVEKVTVVGEYDDFATNPESSPRWTKMGVTSMFEMAYVVKAKGQIGEAVQ